MHYRISDATQQFDSWSRRYDWDPLQTLIFQPSHRVLLKRIRLTDRRLLDVGCGTCVFAAEAARTFPRLQVMGLDLSDGMLRRGQDRCLRAGAEVGLVQGDSGRLPFPDDHFDVVTCAHSFHHYPNQLGVVAEMHRVLRPGGRLMVIDGDRDRPWGRLIFDVVVVWIEGPVKHLSGQAFRELFHRSGFGEVVQYRRRGLAPFLLTTGEAMKGTRSGFLRLAA